jgi:small-conductance mechanosensitive channel
MNEEELERVKAELEAKKAFKDVFENMVDLLQFAVDNSNTEVKPGRLPKDIEARLAQLEKEVDAFCAINNQGADKITSEFEQQNNLSDDEKPIFERSKRVIREAEEKIAELDEVLKEQSKSGKPVNTDEEVKKKYKRFGRQKRWDRL